VSEAASWADRWRALTAPDTTWIDAPRSAAAREEAIRMIRDLGSGHRVAIRDARPFSARRCRSFARAAGVTLERSYLAFPSVRAPAYIVEDASGPATYFLGNLAVVPPGVTVLTAPATAGLAVARRAARFRVARAVFGRVFVGWVA
jgi:hypothetical protein